MEIPARTEIVIVSDLVHRNEKWFPKPNEFHPERWLFQEDEVGRHPYSYVPFSAGSRQVGKSKIPNINKLFSC